MTAESKRKLLFLKYSKNLSLFFQNFQERIDLPKGGGYICPIAFTLHSLDDLLAGSSNQLTLEHIPPSSLGGKSICLTRKDINSTTGHSIDKNFLNWIIEKGFKEGKSGIRGHIGLNLPNLKFISADISIIKKKGELNVIIDPGKKNFKLLKREIFDKNIWDGQNFDVSLNFQNKFNHPQKVAFLKYAYLLAFSKVGYSLLFGPKWIVNPHFEKIRNQILNPEEKIIQNIPIIQNDGPRIEGLGVVTDPRELISIFVTFPITYQGTTNYFTVFLPIPYDLGFNSYPLWTKRLQHGEKFDFQFFEIKPFDFSESPQKAIWFYNLLKEYLGA